MGLIETPPWPSDKVYVFRGQRSNLHPITKCSCMISGTFMWLLMWLKSWQLSWQRRNLAHLCERSYPWSWTSLVVMDGALRGAALCRTIMQPQYRQRWIYIGIVAMFIHTKNKNIQSIHSLIIQLWYHFIPILSQKYIFNVKLGSKIMITDKSKLLLTYVY
jgi:hypothetical protein